MKIDIKTLFFRSVFWCFLIVFSQQIAAQTNSSATFPEQKLGVKPPELKGYDKLTDKELEEGWVRLFDGISLYGWSVLNGKFDVQGGLLVNDPNQAGVIRCTSSFVNGLFKAERRKGDDDEWTPISMSSQASDSATAGNWNITLESGQFRDVKFLPSNMKPIFDGKTLKGWKINSNSKPEFKAKIESGTIRLTGGLGSLESEEKYADFVLQLEYKTDKPVNSGLFFRCIPGELMNGYECQIFNHPPEGDYKKFMGTDTGGIFRRQVGRNVGAKDGQWNYLTIFVREDKVSTWVNGIQVADWQDQRNPDPNPRKGRRIEAGTLQFQGHDPETDILIRNIRIGIM